MSGAAPSGRGDEAASDERVFLTEPALWQRLQSAERFEEAAAAWLALQGPMLADAQAGAVFAGTGAETLTLVAAWPGSVAADLAETARAAWSENRSVVRELVAEGAALVGVPLSQDGTLFACAVFRLTTRDPERWRAAIRRIGWGAAWLVARQSGAAASRDSAQLGRARAALDLLAGALEQTRFAAACLASATDLAIRFDCARASIGFSQGHRSRVAAISHTAQFGHEMNLVRSLGACMDEALDQRSLILFPSAAEEAVITTAHAELARLRHNGHVLTVPFLAGDRFVGAFTLERSGDQPFEPETIEIIRAACAAVGPVLEEKRLNDRWLPRKLFDSALDGLKALIGPGHAAAKLTLLVLAGLVILFSLVKTDYRVTSDARIEGLVRRAVVAPYDGYLKTAEKRAGDTVRQGELLAALEDRDLVLERLRWVTERQQRVFEYDKALATRQPATINIVRSQIDQAEAQIKLVDEQLARLKFYAPFDGLIVSGDLSQSIGGAVSRGQVLFEVAPLDDYRVILHVDERVVADVKPGQRGEVLASALPDEPYPFVVQLVTPVAETRNGRNAFRVEGRLAEPSTRLRPGMEGIGKVEVDRRLLIAVWARPVIDWLRLFLWHISP